MKKNLSALMVETERRVHEQSEIEPAPDGWGLFTEQARFDDSQERQGFFFWFCNAESLLVYLPWHALYWTCSDSSEKDTQCIRREAKRLVSDFKRNGSSQADLLFRLNNILVPSGMELAWMGPLSDLLFSTEEIPLRTRLFCRRTLADMEEHGINPLDGSPLPARYLQTFMECLGDFGLEGQGLNNLLPGRPE